MDITALVSRHISQRKAEYYSRDDVQVGVEVYRRDVVVRRKFKDMQSQVGGARRRAVQNFSEASRRRLRFSAANSQDELVSQFCMTYHEGLAPGGDEVKRHLNTFLTALRRKCPQLAYLWVLEFQSRGFPHFHLFLNQPPSDELRVWMARTWNRITWEGEKHRWWHARPENFIPWSMGDGHYLTKYLDKHAQKNVPADFGWVGRFWGASRGLVGQPVEFGGDDLRELDTGDARDPLLLTLRTLSRYQSARWRGRRRSSTLMQSIYSRQVNGGASVFWQLLEHYSSA